MRMAKSLMRAWSRPPPVRGPLSQRRPDDRRSVALCTLLRADEAAVERVLARARRWPRVRVVALTDGEAAGPLFAQGIAVEQVPSPAMIGRHPALGPWRAHLEGRWAMVRVRWQPALVIDEGVGFAAWLDLCDARPSAARQPGGRDDGALATA